MAGRTRILLVDDSEAELELMRHCFEPWPAPLTLDCASHGRQALDYVCASRAYGPPDGLALVVIDYKMPVMDGVEAVRRMREHVASRTLPIVMWSGSADSEDVRRAYDAGVNSYLRKPSTAALAREMLQTVVRYWAHMNCPASA